MAQKVLFPTVIRLLGRPEANKPHHNKTKASPPVFCSATGQQITAQRQPEESMADFTGSQYAQLIYLFILAPPQPYDREY